jgi:hypothetical protein
MTTLLLHQKEGSEGNDESKLVADYDENLIDELMSSCPELEYWLLEDDIKFDENLMSLGPDKNENASNDDDGASIVENGPFLVCGSSESGSTENVMGESSFMPLGFSHLNSEEIKQLKNRLAESMMRSNFTRSQIICQREAMLAVQQMQKFDNLSLQRIADAVRQGQTHDSQSCQYLSDWLNMRIAHSRHQLHSLMSNITYEILIQFCFS